jgi:hypothetical protein
MAIIPTMAPAIRLPALPLRSRGLFVDTIPAVDTTIDGVDRLSFGARYWGPSISPLLAPVAFDCDYAEEPLDDHLPTITFSEATPVDPWTVTAGIRCSTFPLDPGDGSLQEVALDEVRKSISATVAFAATSTTVTTVNLSDVADSQGSYDNVADALEILEDAMALKIGNRRGYIILPVSVLAKAIDARAVMLADGGFETPSGHLVVADAGAVSGKFWGVGQIGWSVTDTRLIDDNGSLNISRNTLTYTAQAEGIVVFNPDHVVSVDYEAPAEAS